ncbi:basic helix-loop-helix (bHLH) DNA-binding superfamily [Canna indica]|uniref:Basic helix-loop-helix (BHLH) DNA-binding superfamily n=1 Tax=Canna indica TaxID=4628 RepID=A0AAQ3QDN7_9LILI|nr:basic helix-loop-helix (bHLH) DNA-binding superfamily [Canna indica]
MVDYFLRLFPAPGKLIPGDLFQTPGNIFISPCPFPRNLFGDHSSVCTAIPTPILHSPPLRLHLVNRYAKDMEELGDPARVIVGFGNRSAMEEVEETRKIWEEAFDEPYEKPGVVLDPTASPLSILQLGSARSGRQPARLETSSKLATKACREKMRRDKLNDMFLELGSLHEPRKTPKTDKATILSEATRMVSQLCNESQKLKESNETLQEKIKEPKENRLDPSKKQSRRLLGVVSYIPTITTITGSYRSLRAWV